MSDTLDYPIADGSWDFGDWYLFSFGAYGTHVWVRQTCLDSALEVAMDWLAENAPGHFVSVDYEEAAKELGVPWDPSEPDERVIEHAECDLTVVGHTSYGDGLDAIPSWEWFVRDATAEEAAALHRKQFTAAVEPGCYGDGTFGHDHTRSRCADVLKDAGGPADLVKSLNGEMPDDSGDEYDACEWLNEHCCPDGYVWDWLDGDFGLWECEEDE